MDDERDMLRTTFDAVALEYDTARPDYPDQLFVDLIDLTGLQPGSHLLEIGCATGKATRPLAARGHHIVAVELGAQLADVARRNLAELPVEVVCAPFEIWEPRPATQFDLIYAATAWHWINPALRYEKAHRLLRPGGHLAFWSALHAFPEGFDEFFTDIQAIYDEIGEAFVGPWPPPPPENIPTDVGEIAASGLFDTVQLRRYVWTQYYTAPEYLALLDTFSGHIAMDQEKRDYLYSEVRIRIAARPNKQVRRDWYAILHVARRRE